MTCDGCVFADACRANVSTYMNHGCRGDACRTARNADQRDRDRERARPDVVPMPRRLPTGQLRTHLDELRAAGMGLNHIARAAKLDPRAVERIASGAQRRVTPRTKERLLGVMPSDLPVHALLDSTQTLEYLDLLRDAGWTDAELARAIRGPQAKKIDVGARVRKATADRVVELVHAEYGPDLTILGDPLAEWRLLLSDVGDRSWRAEGECNRLGGDSKDVQRLFFPTRGEVDVSAARAVCNRCPVKEPCLDFALTNNEQGIWAATTGDNRRDIRHLELTAAEALDLQACEPDRPLADLLTERLRADARDDVLAAESAA